MLPHDRLDRFRRFVRVVERDRRHEVVENMGLDDTVKQMTTDESELPIDRRRSSAGEVPRFRLVVRECGVRVLEEGNRHYQKVSTGDGCLSETNHSPSQ